MVKYTISLEEYYIDQRDWSARTLLHISTDFFGRNVLKLLQEDASDLHVVVQHPFNICSDYLVSLSSCLLHTFISTVVSADSEQGLLAIRLEPDPYYGAWRSTHASKSYETTTDGAQ